MYPNFECNDTILPFYPKFDEQRLFGSHLRVTWFERDFSQSRYNFDKSTTGSNACTLIAVLLASKCFINKIQMLGPEKEINPFLIRALAESMLEGNEVHNELIKQGRLSSINLTVPEGIGYSGMKTCGLTEWKSNLYVQPLEDTLYRNLKSQWLEWVRSSMGKKYQNLYVILICDARSVIIVMQDVFDTVTLIDSHRHTLEKGAVIAVTARPRMKCLCQWFEKTLFNCYQSSPRLYELSFLYFRKKHKSKYTQNLENLSTF